MSWIEKAAIVVAIWSLASIVAAPFVAAFVRSRRLEQERQEAIKGSFAWHRQQQAEWANARPANPYDPVTHEPLRMVPRNPPEAM